MTFITFEGPEGAGKTTQIARLKHRLEAAGHNVVLTREPGGAEEAEALRALLLDPARDWSSVSEALLMYAARDAHWRQTIAPALEAGKVVLCDRFADSTEAYQVDADPAFIGVLRETIVPTEPQLTLLLDLDPAQGLDRALARSRADRFEQKGLAYHQTVRARFLAIAQREPERVAVIAADRSMDEVENQIAEAVNARLPNLLKPTDGRSAPS